MGLTNGAAAAAAKAALEGVTASSESAKMTVYELQLEDDGSPSKQRSVSLALCSFANPLRVSDVFEAHLQLTSWAHSQYIRLPPPVTPYILRISINAGSLASKSGVLYTTFPLDGSPFDRTKFHKKV